MCNGLMVCEIPTSDVRRNVTHLHSLMTFYLNVKVAFKAISNPVGVEFEFKIRFCMNIHQRDYQMNIYHCVIYFYGTRSAMHSSGSAVKVGNMQTELTAIYKLFSI